MKQMMAIMATISRCYHHYPDWTTFNFKFQNKIKNPAEEDAWYFSLLSFPLCVSEFPLRVFYAPVMWHLNRFRFFGRTDWAHLWAKGLELSCLFMLGDPWRSSAAPAWPETLWDPRAAINPGQELRQEGDAPVGQGGSWQSSGCHRVMWQHQPCSHSVFSETQNIEKWSNYPLQSVPHVNELLCTPLLWWLWLTPWHMSNDLDWLLLRGI